MRLIRLTIWWISAFWLEAFAIVVPLGLVAWGSVACGQTYELRVRYDNGSPGQGSAVCVGQGLKQGQWVFLTAGHVLDKGRGATVNGHRISNVRFARGLDLASFEVATGSFEKTAVVKDWPDGINAQVCGFGGNRDAFCFEGSITRYSGGGRIWARNQHTVPGDSGGAVMVQTGSRRCLAGIHWGFGCQAGRCDSEFVTSEQICRHLTQVYGDCPDCRQWPQQVQRQPRPPVSRPAQLASPQVVVAPCQDDLRQLVAEYMRANPVQPGRDGRNGIDGRTPEVDYQRIVGSVLEAIPQPRDGIDGQPGRDGIDGKNGSPGQRGPQGAKGERGLQGPSGPPPTEGQISAAVIAYINANPERFRGPAGEQGPAGANGDRYLAVPDDEAFNKRVDQWLSTNPEVIQRYQAIPELQQQIEEIRTILTQQQLVEVQNPDGSRYSADTKRRLIDPIILKRPEDPK